jgi:hypothetical protein
MYNYKLSDKYKYPYPYPSYLFLPVLHRKMKKFEGLLQNLKKIALFEIIVRTGISLQKFL